MKVEVTDAPKSQKLLKLELEPEKLAEQENIECLEMAKKAKIPGFRPGRTPQDIVRKQYSHQIRSSAIEKVINNAMRDALVSNQINPIAQPDVRDVNIEDGKPVTFSVYVDVFPDVKPSELNAGKFTKYKINVTADDIEKRLENMQESFAEYKDTEREARDKDETIIDFVGKVDGSPFEGGSAQKQPLIIGSNQFIPGFEEGMIGMEKGSIRDIKVKFPEEYHEKSLAGKDAVFTVTLHEVREKMLPELNEEFAKKVNRNAESVEHLRELFKKDMQWEADRELKMVLLDKIISRLLELNPFEVPESIVKEQAEYLMRQSLSRYYQMGVDPELIGIRPEALRQRAMPQAEELVKKAILINAVAQKEGLEVTPEDFNAEVKTLAENINHPYEDMLKDFAANKNQENSLKENILRDKVSVYLATLSEIEEKEVTWKEYEAIQEEERKNRLEEAGKKDVAESN